MLLGHPKVVLLAAPPHPLDSPSLLLSSPLFFSIPSPLFSPLPLTRISPTKTKNPSDLVDFFLRGRHLRKKQQQKCWPSWGPRQGPFSALKLPFWRIRGHTSGMKWPISGRRESSQAWAQLWPGGPFKPRRIHTRPERITLS